MVVYWNMTKKLQRHSCLQSGEEPIAAVYGLGEATLKMADAASSGLMAQASDQSGDFDGPDLYSDEYGEATKGKHTEGQAAAVVGNGVMGLTNQRLLWFKKATVVGKPGEPTATFPLDSVVEARRDGNMIRVEFADGSISGLHVPRTQKPNVFVEEVNNATQG